MDGALERIGICEGLVGEMMSFEIVPDNLDVVELGGVFGQPFEAFSSVSRRPSISKGAPRIDCKIDGRLVLFFGR